MLTEADLQSDKTRLLGPIDDALYHNGHGISSTGIKKLLKSPRHFKMPADTDNDALRFGRLFHMAMLEPDRFERSTILLPDLDRRTKEGKAKHQELSALAKERKAELVRDDEMIMLRDMQSACDESQLFQNITRGCQFEIAGYTWHLFPQALTKAKADILGSDYIADLKTISNSDPADLPYQIVRYGYHISAAYYLDVLSDVTGRQYQQFMWIFVDKEQPHGLRFIAASAKMLEIGRREYRRALELYRQCLASDHWPCYPEQFEELELPPSYLRRFE